MYRKTLISALVVAAFLAGPETVLAQGPARGNGLSTSAVIDVKFKLAYAVEIAERTAPGKAIEAVLTPFARGGGSLEATVLRDDKSIVKYRLDANTGETVNVSEQTLESYVTGLDPSDFTLQKTSMAQAISAAENFAQGTTVVGVEAKKGDGGIEFDVNILDNGSERSLKVAAGGTVRSN